MTRGARAAGACCLAVLFTTGCSSAPAATELSKEEQACFGRRLLPGRGWEMTRLIRCAVACCLAVPLATGCGLHKEAGSSLAPEEFTPEAEAILHVGRAYRDAYTARKKPPASTRDLKPYLAKFGDPDKALISPRDGQPYEITWGVVPNRPPRSITVSPFLVWEKSGKDGKRYVLDFLFRVRCLTEEEFETLRGAVP